MVQVYGTAISKGAFFAVPAASQLSATIDKQPARVASVRPANQDKLRFAVLVDISGSSSSEAKWVKQEALELFRGLLATGYEGRLVFFNTQIQMSEKPVDLTEVQNKLDSVQFQGPTALYDAIGEKLLEDSGPGGQSGFSSDEQSS